MIKIHEKNKTYIYCIHSLLLNWVIFAIPSLKVMLHCTSYEWVKLKIWDNTETDNINEVKHI